MQRELLMKRKAVRIVSIRQEEFSWQSTSNLGAVVGAEEGAIVSIPGNEGRIVQAWLNVRGGFVHLHGVLLALTRVDSEG